MAGQAFQPQGEHELEHEPNKGESNKSEPSKGKADESKTPTRESPSTFKSKHLCYNKSEVNNCVFDEGETNEDEVREN